MAKEEFVRTKPHVNIGTPMNGRLVIMEGSLLIRFLLLQWLVALSLWKLVYYRYFCYSIMEDRVFLYSNGW